ncbi:uncharacterized protein Z519_11043 [Cladophialophora bantiana CBS 173.52]|uniref:Uncharacterized protein n=1 Tax=Cladophialophora bantiana (strain ATCC 10958 / CBS 173.52 / CDC B-1940 / NIH 8579) TaxID=1442370 RepID=A0A0D2HVC2_CLAB1|nr:uncharacterized protein Z519_11043 [Cladophialophora bantiana CBS 173.52]KIW88474.1 hypothetical protein Z519_11043 [Cladophialophora bantiana CBS 173.52]
MAGLTEEDATKDCAPVWSWTHKGLGVILNPASIVQLTGDLDRDLVGLLEHATSLLNISESLHNAQEQLATKEYPRLAPIINTAGSNSSSRTMVQPPRSGADYVDGSLSSTSYQKPLCEPQSVGQMTLLNFDNSDPDPHSQGTSVAGGRRSYAPRRPLELNKILSVDKIVDDLLAAAGATMRFIRARILWESFCIFHRHSSRHKDDREVQVAIVDRFQKYAQIYKEIQGMLLRGRVDHLQDFREEMSHLSNIFEVTHQLRIAQQQLLEQQHWED